MANWTRTQIDNLGQRLRKVDPPAADDLDNLLEYLGLCDIARQALEDQLIALGCETTSRLKSNPTLLEKLKRDRPRLSTMQDVVGARVVIEGGRREQDELGNNLRSAFTVIDEADRRKAPMHGYRALHLIVELEAPVLGTIPGEIQIRTPLQHAWAEANELLADLYGRGIRYGLNPDNPDQQLSKGPGHTPASLVALSIMISSLIDETEELEFRGPSPGVAEQLAAVKEKLLVVAREFADYVK